MNEARHMTPGTTTSHMADAGFADAHLASDHAGRALVLGDGPSLIGRKPSVAVPLAPLAGAGAKAAAVVSTLRDHIGVVVASRPQKQMVGVDAGRVVAAVQDAEAGGDRPAPYHPGEPMSQHKPSLNPDVPVALFQTGALPLAATIRAYLASGKQLFLRGFGVHAVKHYRKVVV